MSNNQQIKLLREGFKVWNRWRQHHPNIVPELNGADLSGLKLFKVDRDIVKSGVREQIRRPSSLQNLGLFSPHRHERHP